MFSLEAQIGSASAVTQEFIRSYDQVKSALDSLVANVSGESPRASVDPAGLVISEKLKAQIASLEQHLSNINGITSKFNTADASLGQLRRTLTEIRTQAFAASNTAALDPATEEAIQVGVDQLVESFNMTLRQATFNGANLLDGGQRALADIAELESVDLSSPDAISASIQKIDKLAQEIDTIRIEHGSMIKHELGSAKSSMEIGIENLIAAQASRRKDFMEVFAEFIRFLRQMEIGAAVRAHADLSQRRIYDLLRPPSR
ncbi:MAG: flagellin [Candidatus Zixiibacteriota bacterium]